MMHSIGMAAQDLVRNYIMLAGETMLTRRDGWLGQMKYRVPAPKIDDLRAGSLSTEKLFDPAAFTRATSQGLLKYPSLRRLAWCRTS